MEVHGNQVQPVWRAGRQRISLASEVAGLDTAVAAADAAIAALSTTLAADVTLLQSLPVGRRRSAVVYRVGRKRVLLQHRALLARLAAAVRAARDGDGDAVAPAVASRIAADVQSGFEVQCVDGGSPLVFSPIPVDADSVGRYLASLPRNRR